MRRRLVLSSRRVDGDNLVRDTTLPSDVRYATRASGLGESVKFEGHDGVELRVDAVVWGIERNPHTFLYTIRERNSHVFL
jgi:hypothetical protein